MTKELLYRVVLKTIILISKFASGAQLLFTNKAVEPVLRILATSGILHCMKRTANVISRITQGILRSFFFSDF